MCFLTFLTFSVCLSLWSQELELGIWKHRAQREKVVSDTGGKDPGSTSVK